MRRKLLVVTALMGVLTLSAQKANTNELLQAKPGKPGYVSERVDASPVRVSNASASRAESNVGEVIGHTTYDLQTNAANPARLVIDADGNVQTTWTGSASMVAPNFADRGSYYRYWNASTQTWTEEPTARIEGETRTGWPANGFLGNGGEIVISHDPASGNYNLVVMTRDVAGTGKWSDPVAINNNGIWPRLATSGNHVHVVYTYNIGTADNADNGYTQYAHSSDNGATWDTIDMVLPGLSEAEGVPYMSADAYAIAAKDSIVAIVGGSTFNKMWLWKSMDYGTTWTRTVILETGLNGYDVREDAHITDINNDNVGDTITTNDEAYEILLDENGQAHVWTGRMVIIDDAGDAAYSYFPYMSAVMYWNESMGTDGIEVIENAIIKDLDDDGALVEDLGSDLPGYGAGIISMPGAAYDDSTGNIYLVYSAMVENSDEEEDPADESAESYRDLYGMIGTRTVMDSATVETVITSDTTFTVLDTNFTSDTTITDTLIVGQDTTFNDTAIVVDTVYTYDTSIVMDTNVISDTITITTYEWSEPVNLTNTALNHFENVYASVADVANGKVHVQWMMDDEPGHALEAEADDVRENDILYNAFDYSDFMGSAPIPSFDDTLLSCSRAKFTSTSVGEIWSYTWMYGDGFSGEGPESAHTYTETETNSFEVCLTVSNGWGDSTTCKTIQMCTDIEELETSTINVYPNPTAGNVNVEIAANNAVVEVSNILGSVIYTQQVMGAQTLALDLSNEFNGVYFVKVTVDDKVYTQKITLSK